MVCTLNTGGGVNSAGRDERKSIHSVIDITPVTSAKVSY